MPEPIKIYQPNYTLSTQLHSYLYVADCKHPSFEDATNLIFRSKPDKFNIFDWSRDFVSIPSTPKAITSFNGRIVVWDFNNMYIINPSGLYIEDTFEGTGCLNSTSFERTEYGICFADENNIYLYDGKEVNNIGIPIVTSHKQGLKISWRNRDKQYPTHIKFESDKRCFCIFFKISGDSNYNWLLRAIKASKYSLYSDLDPSPERWYDIPGSDINFSIGESPYTYIWHLGMWKEQFQNVEIDSKEDYEFISGGQTIVLPYGTGYNLETKNYIVDLKLFFSSDNINGLLTNYSDELMLGNNLFILQKNDYPNYANIITDGKIQMEHTPSYYFFTYNIDKNRWDLQLTSKYKGVFNGAKGELYSSMLTRKDAVLDLSAITPETEKFFTYGDNPLGGRANIIDELDLDFGQNANVQGKIVDMKFRNKDNDNEERYEIGYNGKIISAVSGWDGSQWYVDFLSEEPHNLPNLFNRPNDMFPTTFKIQGFGNNSQYSNEFQITDKSFEVNDYKIRVLFGSNNPLNYYDNVYSGGTWEVPELRNTEKPLEGADFSSGFSDFNSGEYIEVVCELPHNLSAGDTVIIKEDNTLDKLPDSWSDIKTKLSPYHLGKPEVVTYVVDENIYRFEIKKEDPYFETLQWLSLRDLGIISEEDEDSVMKFWAKFYHEFFTLNGGTWPLSEEQVTTWFDTDTFEDISIGDLNRDGGINVQDIAIAQNSTYIVIKGNEFKNKSYTILDPDTGNNYTYYPDILIVDSTSPTNYHRLSVIWCYSITNDSNQLVSYLLLKNDSYGNLETDLGWNTSEYNDGLNPFPDNTEIILDTDYIVLPGDSGLKELFASSESQQFTFISKNFSFENQTTNKLLSKIKIIYSNTAPLFQYMINNNEQWIVPNFSDIVYEENSLYYKIPKDYKKVKSLKIKIMSNSNEANPKDYDTEVDSFSIIYRERGNA